MTRTESLPAPAPGAGHRPGPARRALRLLAILACVPYVSLKTVWVAGGEIGIPAGSVLLEHRRMMVIANSVTVVADVLVVVLALLLTQAWGRRFPTRLLVLPMWAATGLLAPIVTGYPAQLAVALVTGDEKAAAPGEPFLDDWVFGVVYGGFILQGLALGTLFALYARDRWGRPWRGRLGELSARTSGPGTRGLAVAGAVAALVPGALHLLWAAGSTTGLSARRIAERDADFHVLEAERFGFVVAAVAFVLFLVLRRPARLRVRTTLALAWTASAAVGCWGAYMSLVSLLPDPDPSKRVPGLVQLSYAGDMITGFLLAAGVAAFLRESAAPRRRSAGA
ncbi:hypothetical protein GCM10010275_25700 [Streptomyces litmocidini]|uniref:hypothetical protein n=1 Tax=Streptomyces litmocidini TaxID=67318 RepID=UPI00167E5B86|nr:hypothetical protein [Streptomyces litmocidini]GGU88511.1 hypothetical protein GCM10010275_25700 [Streptomyces litmocidini]